MDNLEDIQKREILPHIELFDVVDVAQSVAFK